MSDLGSWGWGGSVGLLLLLGLGVQTDAAEYGRNATALLVHPDLGPKYVSILVARHESIMRTSWGRDVDHVIFHEPSTDTTVLRTKLKGRVVFIPTENFMLPKPAEEQSEICTIGTKSSVGYRSMCWFWYATAWKVLAKEGYRFVLRVDDDVLLKSVAAWPDHPAVISAPSWTNKEVAWVMSGMDKWFSANYKMTDASTWAGPKVEKRNWQLPPSPMTQLMLVDVQAVVSDPRVHKLWQQVYDTGCIYINRWGDLPLWGYTVAALELSTLNMTDWEYFHGSHHRMVKSGWYIF